ncbi:MAG: M12 family metallo-peptidase, partial [Bacteroidota bacterium]
MNKALLFYILILSTSEVFTQDAIARFTATAVEDATQINELEKYYRDFQLITLPTEAIDQFAHATAQPQMQWFFPNGAYWDVALEVAPIRTEAFALRTITPAGERRVAIDTDRINTFRGSTAGRSVRLTINHDFIYGIYTATDGALWYIEPAKRFAPTAASNHYVVYRRKDVIPVPNLKCGQTERARGFGPGHGGGAHGGARGGCVEMDIAVAVDHTLYEDYQTPEEVLNQIEGVANNVNGNFADDFDSSVTIRISELLVSTESATDPWYDGQDASTLLESFRDWSIAGGFQSDFDLGQFWSQRNYTSNNSGSVVGMAFLGAACSNNNYHILEDFTNSAGYLRVMTAHEIGHNLGCSHNFDQWDPLCYSGGRPDHIMDPSVSLANVWSGDGQYNCEGNSKGYVNQFLAENTCLSSCQSYCPKVEGLVADLDRTTPALSLNWAVQEGSSWEVILHNMDLQTQDTFYTAATELVLTDEI